jgi:hypothetical protein
MTTDVYTMDSSAFTAPPWAWSTPDAGIVDIDYTCSVASGKSYCPSPSSVVSQERQILLADIAIAESAGTGSIQYADAYRDVWYATPSGQVGPVAPAITLSPEPSEEVGLSCTVARGRERRSLAALAGAGLCAGVLVARVARRRRRSTGGP